jgi:hypothetical protein
MLMQTQTLHNYNNSTSISPPRLMLQDIGLYQIDWKFITLILYLLHTVQIIACTAKQFQ